MMYKGYLDISRRQDDTDMRKENYNPEKDFHLLFQLADAGSSRKFLEFKIDPAALVSALAMGHHLPIEFEILDDIKLVGKIREHKTFRIRDRGTGKMVVPERISKDGWEYSSGYSNHHTSVLDDGKHYFNCTFIRYVEPASDDSVFDLELEPDLPWEETPTKVKSTVGHDKPRKTRK